MVLGKNVLVLGKYWEVTCVGTGSLGMGRLGGVLIGLRDRQST